MKKIILIGMKGCGKTTLGKLLAQKLQIPFVDMDQETEREAQKEKGKKLTYREIFRLYGEKYFSELETKVLRNIALIFRKKDFVLSCGGRTPLYKENQKIMHRMGITIYIHPDKKRLYERIMTNGIPAFFPYPEDPKRSFEEIYANRNPLYKKLSKITLETGKNEKDNIIDLLLFVLKKYEN